MTSTTDPRALVALLRADTKGRLAKMGLNTDAADALTAALDENDRLRKIAEASADLAEDVDQMMNDIGGVSSARLVSSLASYRKVTGEFDNAALKGTDQ